MTRVRFGVVGLGNMGSFHLRAIAKMDNAELTAVCDILPDRVALACKNHGGTGFMSHKDLLAAGLCDAVLIATPHYSHTPIGIDALKAGLHVLVEKPISVHKADCLKLMAAHTRRKQVFATMLNQRTSPQYKAVQHLLATKALGPVQRIVWQVTNWYRTEAYYQSSPWRATWRGEGGGVLMNQATHQLDLLYWLMGMPARVTAFCGLGKYHRIEVEDDVTAYLEYPGGASGIFITSTGDAPGVNRLEITGDLATVRVENGSVMLMENNMSARRMSRTSSDCYAAPSYTTRELAIEAGSDQHMVILKNFVAAIRDGAPLIAPAREGIHGVELGNAILMSALQGRAVELPLDAAAYERLLKKLIAGSRKPMLRRASGAPRMNWMFGK